MKRIREVKRGQKRIKVGDKFYTRADGWASTSRRSSDRMANVMRKTEWNVQVVWQSGKYRLFRRRKR